MTIKVSSGKLVSVDPGDTTINRKEVLMDLSKDPVSSIGGGVFIFDIQMKHANYPDFIVWQVICNRNSIKSGADFEHILILTEFKIITIYPLFDDVWFLSKNQNPNLEIIFDNFSR